MHSLAVPQVQLVERRHRVIVVLSSFHVVDTMDTVAPLADPMRLRLVVTFGVGHRFRAFDLGLSVAALVTFGGLEGIVDGLKRKIEKERPLGISTILEPCQGLIRQHIGRVSLEIPALVVDVERWVEVSALALEAGPMVEAGSRGVVVVTHVPLADKGRLISGLLQVLWEEHRSLRCRPLVVNDLMVVHVLSGKYRRPARRA